MKNGLIVLGIIAMVGLGFLMVPKSSSEKTNTTEEEETEMTAEATATAQAVISTSKGDITIDLYGNEAPNTVANFVSKAKSNYYKDLIFHRVEDWVLQGGDPDGNGTGGGKMATELNSVPFATGAVGVARGNDIEVSNDSQFFIVKSDASWLDGQYTNFGMVTAGMDVVNAMAIGDKILSITVK